MRYVVLGAGAVGGVVAGNLHLAGVAVTLVARGAHLAAIRAAGLVLDRVDGRHTVTAPATDTVADIAWTDETVVLLAVKSHQTVDALEDLAAHAPAPTPVVALQNGVANETEILRRFGSAYAVCVMLPATHLEPGVVVQRCWPVPGILDIGRFPEGVDQTVEAIAADLRTAGFESRAQPSIMAWKHRKLLVNAVGDARWLLSPGAECDELVRRVAEEGEAVLAAAGVEVVSAAEDESRRGDLLRPRPDAAVPAGNSLLQSRARGLSTEIDYRAGEIVLLGRLHGVATPANELIQRTVHEQVRGGMSPGRVDAGPLLAGLA